MTGNPPARLLALASAAAFVLLAGPGHAQGTSTRAEIWRLELGTPVTDLPAKYLDPHCGTDGGPPSVALEDFTEFARCPPDRSTGLHEIWFSEDDEAEYVARAYRAQMFEPGPAAANVLLVHKVIYSILVDDAGLVQGYRIITDPREPENYRIDADFVGDGMRGVYGYGRFTCTQLPPDEGETPIETRFLKEDCFAEIDGRSITIQRRYFYKPGQTGIDPVTGRATQNQFESSTRIEVIATDLLPR